MYFFYMDSSCPSVFIFYYELFMLVNNGGSFASTHMLIVVLCEVEYLQFEGDYKVVCLV